MPAGHGAVPEATNELCKIIDPEKDSLRFYYLGKKYENKIEHFGCKQTYLPEEPMIL